MYTKHSHKQHTDQAARWGSAEVGRGTCEAEVDTALGLVETGLIKGKRLASLQVLSRPMEAKIQSRREWLRWVLRTFRDRNPEKDRLGTGTYMESGNKLGTRFPLRLRPSVSFLESGGSAVPHKS